MNIVGGDVVQPLWAQYFFNLRIRPARLGARCAKRAVYVECAPYVFSRGGLVTGATGADGIKRWLQQVPLFSDLSDQQLELLSVPARFVRVAKGARIFEEGAPADCCYVLTSGRAKVVLESEDGVEVLVNEIVPVELVGELALIDGSVRSAALVAAEPCRFVRIPATAFDAILDKTPFERKLLARIALTLRLTTQRMLRAATGSANSRVAWYLLWIAQREGKRDGAVMIIPKKPDQELASMAGCARETATRALGKLKEKGLVSWDTRTMRLDVDGLQRNLRHELAARRPGHADKS
jgi:CRP-like cAMP-binding protein